MLNKKEVIEILERNFEIEFMAACITQQTSTDPRVMQGSASIRMNDGGQLELKLYHAGATVADFFRGLADLSGHPGVLIEPHRFYSFVGVDMERREWRASGFRTRETGGGGSGGSLICADLFEIECRQARLHSEVSSSSTRVIPGIYRLPFNEGQEDFSEPAFSKLQLSFDRGRSCEIKTFKESIYLNTICDPTESSTFHKRVQDAVGVACGAHLSPVVETTITNDEAVAIIRSYEPKASEICRLNPIIDWSPGNLPDFCSLLEALVQYEGDDFSKLLNYWHRVLRGFDSGFENSALVLGTAIEGILTNCFVEEAKAKGDFVKMVEDAAPIIKALVALSDRAKERILSSLGSAKTPSAKNALHALRESGKITQEMVKGWSDLRNKASHAAELKATPADIQKFVDQLHACLELFYRLTLLRVNYNGKIQLYGQRGWPLGGMQLAVKSSTTR